MTFIAYDKASDITAYERCAENPVQTHSLEQLLPSNQCVTETVHVSCRNFGAENHLNILKQQVRKLCQNKCIRCL